MSRFMQTSMLSLTIEETSAKGVKTSHASLTNLRLLKHGILYPRWLVLAAMLDILWGIVQRVIESSVPCTSTSPLLLSFYCDKITGGAFFVQSLCIMGVFFLGWLLFFLCGYQFFEQPTAKIAPHLNTILAVENLRGFLVLLAVPVIMIIILMYSLKNITTFPFILAFIVAVIAIRTFFYHPSNQQIDWPSGSKATFTNLLRCLPPMRWIRRRRHKKSPSMIQLATYPELPTP